MSRTSLIKKNALLALCVKGGSIMAGIVMVPLTISFISAAQYGIWLTLSTVMTWMAFFDIGFSGGLRNKLAEALAQGDIRQAQSYVSTTYVCLTAIFATLAVVLTGVTWMVDVHPLLNVDASCEPDLKRAVTVVIAYFCVGFVLRTLSQVFKADQRTALGSLCEFIGQAGGVICVYLLKDRVEGSLTVLALAVGLPGLAVWTIASVVCYMGRYRHIRPRLTLARRADVRSLLSLGLKFFVIGIAFIVQFQTSSILIAHLFSVRDVTSYNIVYKYFNVLYMSFFLVIEPLWSAVTDAWTRGDLDWIRRTTRGYLLAFGLWMLGGLVMLVAAPWVYDWWIARRVDEVIVLPPALSCWTLAYMGCTMFASVFCNVINGIGALRIQFCTSLISPFVFLAVTIGLARGCGMGMESVLIGSIVANFYGLICAPVQYWQAVVLRRRGIWTA